MMSTTVSEMGAVYCSVVSFANTQHSYELDRGAIIQSLIAIRLKLKRSLVLRTNIVYEVSLGSIRLSLPILILAHAVLSEGQVARSPISEDIGNTAVSC